MGTAFLYGNGGGGIKLPFRVIGGTTQPSDPKDGDVWVKTSVPIMRTEFANGTWASGGVGLVFLAGTLGGSNPTGTNTTVWAINKNTGASKYVLKITLTGCKQVQGSTGNWVNLDAYRYYGGTWVQFSTTFTATINITYPAGSTCTATCGSTTLTAPNTSGTWACVVPNAGTWTVTVVDKGWTDSVAIAENGQTAYLDITAFYLFRSGDQYPDRTGGWTNNPSGTANVIFGDDIVIEGNINGPTYSHVYTVDRIQFDGKFSTLIFDIYVDSNYPIYSSANIGYGVSDAVNTDVYISGVADEKVSIAGNFTKTVDISNVNVPLYVQFAAYGAVYHVKNVRLV